MSLRDQKSSHCTRRIPPWEIGLKLQSNARGRRRWVEAWGRERKKKQSKQPSRQNYIHISFVAGGKGSFFSTPPPLAPQLFCSFFASSGKRKPPGKLFCHAGKREKGLRMRLNLSPFQNHTSGKKNYSTVM